MPSNANPSNAPDTAPSRGDDDLMIKEEIASSMKRKSHHHSRGSGESRSHRSSHSSHRRSPVKDGRRRSSTKDSSPRPSSRSRSPRRSSHRRSSTSSGKNSSSRTPDSKNTEKQKIRLIEADGSVDSSGHRRSSIKTPDSSKNKEKQKIRLIEVDGTVRSLPLHSSPGAVDSSGYRRSSIKTPDSSKNKEKQKLRLAEADVADIRSPSSSSSHHRRSSRSSRRASRTPDSRANKTKRRVRLADGGDEGDVLPPPLLAPEDQPEAMDNEDTTPVIATTAPNFDELEAARQEGRRVGRQEGRREGRQEEREQRSQEGQVIIAERRSKEDCGDNNNKKKYFIALVILLFLFVAAGIAAWLLLTRGSPSNPEASSDSSLPPQDTTSPSEEDCHAVSMGFVPTGKNETDPKAFGLEMDFVVSSSVKTDLLQTELEFRMRQDVLPAALVGCTTIGCFTDKSISIESNNNFVGGILNAVSVGDPAPCNADRQGLCSTVRFEMDLFLKDTNGSNENLANLLKDFFQDKCLLVLLLNLDTPIENVYFNYVDEIIPSKTPSSSPTSNGDSPLRDNCLEISNGEGVEDQEEMTVKEYDILLDVMLDSEIEDLSAITIELEEKIQELLMPSLAGCPHDQDKRLELPMLWWTCNTKSVELVCRFPKDLVIDMFRSLTSMFPGL